MSLPSAFALLFQSNSRQYAGNMRTFWESIRLRSLAVKAGEAAAGVDLPRILPSPMGEWKGLARRGLDPFDPEFAAVSEVLSQSPEVLPRLAQGAGEPYLPIEALRDFDLGQRLFLGAAPARTFLSSGTTQSSRSTSHYSAAGLEAYRWGSLYTFRSVLSRVLGVAPEGVQGFSLIPSVAEWPDSSLAQMVAWIGEVLPLQYVTPEVFSVPGAGCDEPRTLGTRVQPIWLFATAFHLVDLIDRGQAHALPPGSVVIETGGTKGRARSVTRAELYTMIEGALGVPAERIVSEYGMCELASQAYDFVDGAEWNTSRPRTFRFPAWVRVSTVTGVGSAQASGQGALLVDDPLRFDYPWPLRTEDLVALEKNGNQASFQLLGRLDRAPLKGCSLLAEREPSLARPAALTTASLHGAALSLGLRPAGGSPSGLATGAHGGAMLTRAARLWSAMTRWLDDHIVEALALELGSHAAAAAARADLQRSLPATPAALVEAARTAAGADLPGRWLFILPRSHSLVGLYPIAMGYVLGLEMTVRVPEPLAQERSVIGRFLRLIGALPEAHLQVVPPTFRIVPGAMLEEVDAVLAYGADETIEGLQRSATLPVRGFGGRLGLSLATAQGFQDQVPAIVRDAFTLCQRGCMATRLLIVHDPDGVLTPQGVACVLQDAVQAFWQAEIPWSMAVALDPEAFRLKQLGFFPQGGSDPCGPLVAVRTIDLATLESDLSHEVLARVPFTLPVVLQQGGSLPTFVQALTTLFQAWPPLAACSVPLDLLSAMQASGDGSSFAFRVLGTANAPVWDGTHEGFSLFSSAVLS